jgi:integrase
LKTFSRKTDANNFAANTRIDIGKGVHVAERASITVGTGAELWLAECRADNLEQSTIAQYEQHTRIHIIPFIGAEKLSKLTVPFISAFRDRLRTEGRSDAMVKGVMRSLSSLISAAQERGQAAHNPVRELRRTRRGRGKTPNKRHKRKLCVGVDIPTPAEMKALIAAAKGMWRPFLMTAAFTGLRASELRGLRWEDVDLKNSRVHVRQRADRFSRIGPPKSESGHRKVPLPKPVALELTSWKLRCPKKDGRHWLVFPNGRGNIELLGNIIKRGLIPAMIAANITKPALDDHSRPKRDEDGKPILKAKYSGLHTLRHFYASFCINRKADGGLELPAKIVQERLGHSTIGITLDTYSHLFPSGDDTSHDAAVDALLGP